MPAAIPHVQARWSATQAPRKSNMAVSRLPCPRHYRNCGTRSPLIRHGISQISQVRRHRGP